MRFMPRARLGVVTQEQKEARLKDFIGHHIESVRIENYADNVPTYRLLALSAESPAAVAMSKLAAEIAAAGIKVEAVLVRKSRSAEIAADCRFVNDLRLLDAHEQLVLDHRTVWTGDCMRRDPLRRDAYEHFSNECQETAAHAARSFAHIWRAAGPSGSLTAARALTGPRLPNLFDPSLLAGVDPAGAPTPALLRH
jgi:hypothetical protein